MKHKKKKKKIMLCLVVVNINRKSYEKYLKILYSKLVDFLLSIFFIHFRPYPRDEKIVKWMVWTAKVQGGGVGCGTRTFVVRPSATKKTLDKFKNMHM